MSGRDPKRRLRDIGEAWRLLEDGDAEALPPHFFRSSLPWIAIAVLAVTTIVVMWAPWRAEPQRSLSRVDVDLGAAVELPPVLTDSNVVISPDGRWLLYTSASQSARGFRGQGRGDAGPLSLLRLDQTKAAIPVQLRGTEGATGAFFSPDSKWIGFMVRDSIKKISVEGASTITMAEFGGSSSVAWGENDTILVARGALGLWRIPASGEPVKVNVKDAPNDLRIYQILPGGKAALAVVYAGGRGIRQHADTATIEAVSLTDGSLKPVVPGGTSPRYLPTGHLLYLNKGTLFAVPFDPDKLQTTGNAVSILDDVQFNETTGAANLSFSRDGVLVFRKGTGINPIEVMPGRVDSIDAAGKRSPLISEIRRYLRPRFSPDGNQLALLISEPGSRDEWVYDLRGDGFPKPITFGGLNITTATWLDNNHVVFGNGPANSLPDTGATNSAGIYWTSADGASKPQPLLRFKGLPFVTAYSAALKRLVFFARGGGILTTPVTEENGQLKAGEPEQFMQSQFSDPRPSFSPDGHWIAYSEEKAGRQEVYVQAYPPAHGGTGS